MLEKTDFKRIQCTSRPDLKRKLCSPQQKDNLVTTQLRGKKEKKETTKNKKNEKNFQRRPLCKSRRACVNRLYFFFVADRRVRMRRARR